MQAWPEPEPSGPTQPEPEGWKPDPARARKKGLYPALEHARAHFEKNGRKLEMLSSLGSSSQVRKPAPYFANPH